MFGLSGEHILVILVMLLIFGPKRLPDLGNSLGRSLKNFKDAMNGNDNAKAAPIPAQTAQQLPVTPVTVAPVAQEAARAPAEHNV